MMRLLLPALCAALALLLPCAVPAQCLDGDCVNGTGVKLTRGHTYTGTFKNNHRHGQGLYEFPNGDRYQGGFAQGLMEGNGIYYFVNGDRFEGEFLNNRREGVGTLYMTEHTLRGVWSGGMLVGPGEEVVSEELIDPTNLDFLSQEETETDAPMSDQELDTMLNEILGQ